MFSQMVCGPKLNSLKAVGAETSGGMRDEKMQAVVVRSTCWNQNAQNILVLEYFAS